MRGEDLIAYLDGECTPEAQEEIERALIADATALARFRLLCRQRFMLALTLREGVGRTVRAARPPFRIRWEIAVATLLFAFTVTALWMRRDPGPPPGSSVVRGEVLAGGRAVRHLPSGTPVEVPAGSTAEIRLQDGSEVVLYPLSRAVFHGPVEGVRELAEIGRGKADFRVTEGRGQIRVRTPAGTLAVRGAEFSVELVSDADPKGTPMESMLVRVVSIRADTVQIDVAGRAHSLLAGETRAFRADGAMANSLGELKNREGERPREKDRVKEKREEPRKK